MWTRITLFHGTIIIIHCNIEDENVLLMLFSILNILVLLICKVGYITLFNWKQPIYVNSKWTTFKNSTEKAWVDFEDLCNKYVQVYCWYILIKLANYYVYHEIYNFSCILLTLERCIKQIFWHLWMTSIVSYRIHCL